MSDTSRHSQGLQSGIDCAICAAPLVYSTEPVECVCDLCGTTATALIACPAGHYVCDACHEKEAIDVMRGLLAMSSESDPALLAERLMALPSVTMHGPEHHALVPGGWCGYYGACGAGVAVAVLTQSTPLRGRERSLSLAATSAALARMLDDGPRCCKRATRVAIAAGVGFMREHLGIELPRSDDIACARAAERAAQRAVPA